MGYKFQFITLAGFHALNYSMFNLAHGYARRQMSAFVELQEAEFAAAEQGLHRGQAPARGRHRLLRRGDPDDPGRPVARPRRCKGSTEDEQFHADRAACRGRQVTRQPAGRSVGGRPPCRSRPVSRGRRRPNARRSRFGA